MKQSMNLTLRACRLFAERQPGLFPWMLVYHILEAVVPYVDIFFSARIIGVLAGSRDVQELQFWVLLTLSVNAALELLKACSQKRYNVENNMVAYTMEQIYCEKRMDMDYPDAVSQQTQSLMDQITELDNYTGNGIRVLLLERLPGLIRSSASVLSGLVLTVQLFLSPVTEPGYRFLNNPLMPLLMLGLMFGLAQLCGWIDKTSYNRFMAETKKGTFGNNLFSYFGFRVYNGQGRKIDMRLYDQFPVCRYYTDKYNVFGARGPMAKLANRYTGPMRALSAAVDVSFLLFAYLFVCLKAWGGAFGIDGVSQYVAAITAMASGIASLSKNIGFLEANGKAMENVFQYLDTPNAMYQGSLTTEKRSDRRYNVEFKDVSFRYPGTDFWALRHVNMKFRIGSRMAVVGENGSGKTTFIKLLCRLYDPTEGQILLNGIDIRKYRYDDYMNIFSVVFQDFQFPAYTLAEAVAAGRDIDRDRIGACLNLAGFGHRLKTLPKGLDTVLYKDLDREGVEISGGEAQKIAIARTLYKDAPFLILDEPTAALDPKAEAEIYEKFNQIAGDKTAIYISHRLSSCKFCDEITVFDHGTVVQQGSHDALLTEEGKYSELWNAQAQYYTE